MTNPIKNRICFTVPCTCGITALLSCVSVVFLAVAVYKPAYHILSSGFLETPVMCTTTTIANVARDDPDGPGGGGGGGWNSCSEWCLFKSVRTCPRIMVDARRNGTNVRLEGCESIEIIECSGIDFHRRPKWCIAGECSGMDGLFTCEPDPPENEFDLNYGSKCRDVTRALQCNFTNTDDESNCERANGCLNLNGTYFCLEGICKRILPPYKCQRLCVGIQTANKTVIIREGDKIFSAQCGRAVNTSNEKEIWPLTFRSSEEHETLLTLVMFCTSRFPREDNRTFIMSDCFNGTLFQPDFFGSTTNLAHLVASHNKFVERGIYNRDIGMKENIHGLVGPSETDLLIYNNTRLYINFESCVNLLFVNECEKFYADYGGDGSDFNSQSKFPCFYDPDNAEFVTLRFNRAQTILELTLATTIPITLAIVACLTLIIRSQIKRVGDDSKGEPVEAMPLEGL